MPWCNERIYCYRNAIQGHVFTMGTVWREFDIIGRRNAGADRNSGWAFIFLPEIQISTRVRRSRIAEHAKDIGKLFPTSTRRSQRFWIYTGPEDGCATTHWSRKNSFQRSQLGSRESFGSIERNDYFFCLVPPRTCDVPCGEEFVHNSWEFRILLAVAWKFCRCAQMKIQKVM